MTLFVLSVLMALGISALCSLTEATLLSLTPSQVADLYIKRPKVGAAWKKFKTNIERPMAFILILNTAAHTTGAAIAGAQFEQLWGSEMIWLFSLLFTIAMLQFTEILPKGLGVRHNKKLAPYIAGPLTRMVFITLPIIKLVHWLNGAFYSQKNRPKTVRTIDEIRALATMARISREITPMQEEVIEGVSDISETTIADVMIPYEKISFLSISQPLEDAVLSAERDAHTRFPVRDDRNEYNIVGYVNFKDLVAYTRIHEEDGSIEEIIRDVHRVHPEETVADSLREFIRKRIHISIVVDGTGTTIGLVTLEDLLEEIVGDVKDEFDA